MKLILFFSDAAIAATVVVKAAAWIEEGRVVEIEAVHLNRALVLLPRSRQVVASQLDYFCASGNHLERQRE